MHIKYYILNHRQGLHDPSQLFYQMSIVLCPKSLYLPNWGCYIILRSPKWIFTFIERLIYQKFSTCVPVIYLFKLHNHIFAPPNKISLKLANDHHREYLYSPLKGLELLFFSVSGLV